VYRVRQGTTVTRVPAPTGIIGPMDDLKTRLAAAEEKLSHVKEYL
jgi:hypothetical protein